MIVGSRRALARAIGIGATDDRYCWLEERLRAALEGVRAEFGDPAGDGIPGDSE